MRKLARLLFYIFALLFLLLPFFAHDSARAQFTDQRQFAIGTGGSANAQTVAISNYQLNIGVVIRFVPSFTNTGATTLNVNGQGNVPVARLTATGVQPLLGGEIVNGQTAEVVFDGARFVLLTSSYIGNLSQLPVIPGNTVIGNASGTAQTPGAMTTLPTGLTVPSPIITGGTSSGTLTNGTVGFGTNVCSNNYVPVTANLTPPANGSGSYYQVTNRTTVTFSPTAGFYPAGYCATIHNANTNMTVKVSLNGSTTFILWPGQTETVNQVAGGLTYSGPRRYKTNGSITLFAAPSPNCNDNNDGLTQDAAGQFCTINKAIAELQTYFDSSGNNPIIQLADGTYTQEVDNAGQCICSKDGIEILGHTGNSAAVLLNAPNGGYAATARDYGILFLNYMEVACPTGSLGGINASQFSTIDVTQITFGSCTNLTLLGAQDGGHIDFDLGMNIAGNAAQFAYAVGVGSQVTFTNQSIACSGGLNFSVAFVEANNGGHINAGGGASFTGCGGVSGTRYIGNGLGIIDSGGQGANFFPGTAAGTLSNGAIYE